MIDRSAVAAWRAAWEQVRPRIPVGEDTERERQLNAFVERLLAALEAPPDAHGHHPVGPGLREVNGYEAAAAIAKIAQRIVMELEPFTRNAAYIALTNAAPEMEQAAARAGSPQTGTARTKGEINIALWAGLKESFALEGVIGPDSGNEFAHFNAFWKALGLEGSDPLIITSTPLEVEDPQTGYCSECGKPMTLAEGL